MRWRIWDSLAFWGGLDHQERKALQGKLGITPIFMTDTYNRNSYSLLGGVKDGR
jgi:hypothetical protein